MARVTATFGAPWGQSQALQVQQRAPHPAAQPADVHRCARWQHGAAVHSARRSAWGVALVCDGARTAHWPTGGAALQREAMAPWGVARQADRAHATPWAYYTARPGIEPAVRWGISTTADVAAAVPWGQYAGRPAAHIRPVWARASTADAQRWLPWTKYSRQIRKGWGVVTPPDEPPIDEHGTWLVPVRRVYIMTNTATLVRVDDSTVLPVLSLTASTDADSWAWRVDAALPASSMDAVMPGLDGAPVLLQATINGHSVRWLAESVSRERVFGSDRIRVSGRSPSAVLAEPFAVAYAYASADAITAQQAALAAITAAGLPLGWSLGWHITDWLLPAGLWQHQGSPMSAVQRIAAAAGAYVQTDRTTQVLHISHRYPASPWDWGALTPDVVLPIAPVLREAVEWVDKPAYNEVYVRGQAVGVNGHIVKTGTTGGLLAGDVVDDLITHADAARQRGRAVLGDTGRQQRISLSLPINDDTGLLAVGQLIDVTEGLATRRGLVRSVALSYATPKARQTVEVEVHV